MGKCIFLDRFKVLRLQTENKSLSETINAKIFEFRSSVNRSKVIGIGSNFTH